MRSDNRSLEERIADRTARLDTMQDELTSAVEKPVTRQDWARAAEAEAVTL